MTAANEPSINDLNAGDNFRRSVLSKADAHDPYPLWHGWVIMDAFLAGAAYARRAQPAAGVDDAEYTQGLAYDGVVILKDGQPITIDEVLAILNARSGTVDKAKEMEERVKEALWRGWVDRTGWKRESAKLGCGAALEHGQHWRFCGETDMGQTLPALCKECGGEYARARGGK